jgi:hypothetical protein
MARRVFGRLGETGLPAEGAAMCIGWSKLACSPDDAAVAALRRASAWFIPGPWRFSHFRRG